ncbi:hypothetical protein K0651_01900 [Ornithinimicrobium sp. Arc0846-15]|nr:hypothetical protein [Ornithinimicrobium laminariae]
MNVRTLVGRTVIAVLTDEESIKGTVEPASTKDTFVLSRPLVMAEHGDGPARETTADGEVWIPLASVRWVQVI